MHIILFDGICHFCSATVRFIIERDEKAYFRFASLQSEAGQALLKKYPLSEQSSNPSFRTNDTYFSRSNHILDRE